MGGRRIAGCTGGGLGAHALRLRAPCGTGPRIADDLAWIAGDHRVGRGGKVDNGTGANDDAVAEVGALQQDCACADPDVVAERDGRCARGRRRRPQLRTVVGTERDASASTTSCAMNV